MQDFSCSFDFLDIYWESMKTQWFEDVTFVCWDITDEHWNKCVTIRYIGNNFISEALIAAWSHTYVGLSTGIKLAIFTISETVFIAKWWAIKIIEFLLIFKNTFYEYKDTLWVVCNILEVVNHLHYLFLKKVYTFANLKCYIQMNISIHFIFKGT